MNGLLAILFNGLLLFPSNTDAIHSGATTNEVLVNEHTTLGGILSLCNVSYTSNTTLNLSFSIDENKQVHIYSATGPDTELDPLVLVKLESLLQTQAGCLPVDQPISISLRLNNPEKKIS